jgi:hypothetical protein
MERETEQESAVSAMQTAIEIFIERIEKNENKTKKGS